MTNEEALAQVTLNSFVALISANCGLDTPEAEMTMIGYEAAVAASVLEQKQKGGEPPKKDLLETD